ncbi:MAG TPA: GAF domain-containing protein, partial [Sorangium sp.]|nr:GAF domain-containing protein [Sorangium sp.]
MDLLADDPRTRTTLVCGSLALAIAASSLLRAKKVRQVHWLFAATAADIGFWYLSQSLFGFFQAPLWDRLRVLLAVLLPVFAANLFEAMVPDETLERQRARVGRWSLVAAIPMLLLALSPYLGITLVRVTIFLYVTLVVAASLYELGQRGHHSRSRAIQRRVRFLTVTGALAGLFSVADFAWVIGYEPAYSPPPVGVVLSVVFLFMLAQALRHERLLDLYEMLGRLVVAIAVSFIIAGVFYVLVTGVGQFNTMWLNALLVAIVVLVLFNPLRDWVEKQIVSFVWRDRHKLQLQLSAARRRLAHTLELTEMGAVVMAAFERSRAITTGALYVRIEDGTVFEQLASCGEGAPHRIEVATAHALLEQLEHGPVLLEQTRRHANEGHRPAAGPLPDAVLAAAEVLGVLRDSAVVVAVRAEEGDLVGLLVVADNRIGDAFAPEDVSLLEGLATQIGVVVENSRVYDKMKERDRLAVLGQMAAGLAHEIRNPLGAIKGAAQLLADPHPDGAGPDDTAREFIGIILEEVERLDSVVGSVLDLARQNTHVVAPIDVNAV